MKQQKSLRIFKELIKNMKNINEKIEVKQSILPYCKGEEYSKLDSEIEELYKMTEFIGNDICSYYECGEFNHDTLNKIN